MLEVDENLALDLLIALRSTLRSLTLVEELLEKLLGDRQPRPGEPPLLLPVREPHP